MEGIHKYYPGVHALKGVDFDLKKGEVCAILGENGAGKSTLMNVLGGVVQNEEGSIYLAGRKMNIKKYEGGKRTWHCLHTSGTVIVSEYGCCH